MPLKTLTALASTLNDDPSATPWQRFDHAAALLFGHTLFTVLACDAPRSLLLRQYSNHAGVSPPDGFKRMTDNACSRRLYKEGKCFLGSTRTDLQVFPEYESLWEIGCESVLNIPVRHRGNTIGSLNLLGAAHQYDGYDENAALMLAKLAAPYLLESLQNHQPAQPQENV